MSLFDPAVQPALDDNGNPISDASWNFYLAGTLTPSPVYADAGLITSLGAVVDADGAGRFAPIFIDDATSYRAILKDDLGATISDLDPVTGVNTNDLADAIADLTDEITQGAAWENVELPASGPTAAINAVAGNLNGLYYYRVSYVSPAGETDVGIPSAGVSPVNQQVNLTNIPISPDPSVTARKIYRTVAGENEPALAKYVATINDNTTTTYGDNLADAGLGAGAPFFNSTGGGITINGEIVFDISTFGTRIGNGADPLGTGYANTACGANTLRLNTTGYRNTAYGVDALEHNTTGVNNTAMGVHALGDNVTGLGNTAVGLNALAHSTTSNNTAVGADAGAFTTTGAENTFFGSGAGLLNTTGNHNNCFGYNAGANLTTGSGNLMIGYRAGVSENTGNFNTYLGFQVALLAAGASSNVGIGYHSLFNNVTGSSNVAIGPAAGYWETGGNSLWIDNQPRTNLADAKAKALVYGQFGTTVDQQSFKVNGQVITGGGLSFPVTATKSGAYSMLATDQAVTFTGAGTITLLDAATYPGRTLILRTTAAAAVISASANVVPLVGGAAGTAILAATAGKWAFLMSDGTNWQVVMGN